MVREREGRPLFYMTWAKEAFPGQIDRLAEVYRGMGEELDVPVAPVGIAWDRVRSERPDLDLFHEDGSHPSPPWWIWARPRRPTCSALRGRWWGRSGARGAEGIRGGSTRLFRGIPWKAAISRRSTGP